MKKIVVAMLFLGLSLSLFGCQSVETLQEEINLAFDNGDYVTVDEKMVIVKEKFSENYDDISNHLQEQVSKQVSQLLQDNDLNGAYAYMKETEAYGDATVHMNLFQEVYSALAEAGDLQVLGEYFSLMSSLDIEFVNKAVDSTFTQYVDQRNYSMARTYIETLREYISIDAKYEEEMNKKPKAPTFNVESGKYAFVNEIEIIKEENLIYYIGDEKSIDYDDAELYNRGYRLKGGKNHLTAVSVNDWGTKSDKANLSIYNYLFNNQTPAVTQWGYLTVRFTKNLKSFSAINQIKVTDNNGQSYPVREISLEGDKNLILFFNEVLKNNIQYTATFDANSIMFKDGDIIEEDFVIQTVQRQ